MDKIAVGPGYPEGIVDLDKSPSENLSASPRPRASTSVEIIVCVLDRPRHSEKLIAKVRAIRRGIMLIGDGDVRA
jgi:fructose-1,6-bisphosphatase II / sedoheptulose-1,7-bisphosphatase